MNRVVKMLRLETTPVSHNKDCQIGPAVAEEDEAAEATAEEADFCRGNQGGDSIENILA